MISKKNKNVKKVNEQEAPRPRVKKERAGKKDSQAEENVILSRKEFDDLTGRAASADAQVELYQFQVRNLRKDLEHIKLHSVLSNLGGPVVISESPEAASVADKQHGAMPGKPPRPVPAAEGLDDTPFLVTFEPEPDSVDLEALLEWYLEPPDAPRARAEEERPATRAVSRIKDREEKTEAAGEPPAGNTEAAWAGGREEYSISGVRQNLIACMETIVMLSRKVNEERTRVGNRDMLIQLLKDKGEIEEQKVLDEFVPAAEHAILMQKFNELEDEYRKLELETSNIGAHEEKLNEANTRIEKLGGEIKSLNGRIEALSNEKQAIAAERDDASAAFEKQMADFREKMKSLAGDQLRSGMEIVEQLEKDNAALGKECGSLREEISRVTREYGEQNMELQARIDLLTEEKERVLEQRIPALERLNEELSGDIVLLKRESEGLKRLREKEAKESGERILALQEETAGGKIAAEERLEATIARMEKEHADLLKVIDERDAGISRLEKDMRDVRAENILQKKTNFELMSRMETARQKTRDTADKKFPDIKRKLLDKFAADSSPASLLELRRLFLNTRKYDEAVRTFRQLLIEPGNQKYMPTVCLLVGEFYNLGGRTEEATFYLANPLIKDDPFAQRLLNTINAENATVGSRE